MRCRVSSLFCCQAQAGLHRTGIALHPFKMSEQVFPEPEWLSEEVKTGVSYRLMGLKRRERVVYFKLHEDTLSNEFEA